RPTSSPAPSDFSGFTQPSTPGPTTPALVHNVLLASEAKLRWWVGKHRNAADVSVNAAIPGWPRLLDVIHPEKNIESAVNVRIKFRGAIDRLVAEREGDRHHAVIAPVPTFKLLSPLLPHPSF